MRQLLRTSGNWQSLRHSRRWSEQYSRLGGASQHETHHTPQPSLCLGRQHLPHGRKDNRSDTCSPARHLRQARTGNPDSSPTGNRCPLERCSHPRHLPQGELRGGSITEMPSMGQYGREHRSILSALPGRPTDRETIRWREGTLNRDVHRLDRRLHTPSHHAQDTPSTTDG